MRFLRDSEERHRFLAECGAALAASLEHEATLQTLAQLVIPTLADYCLIYLVRENGRIQQVAVAHPEPAKEDLLASWGAYTTPPANPSSLFGLAMPVRRTEADRRSDAGTRPRYSARTSCWSASTIRSSRARGWWCARGPGSDAGVISLATSDSSRRYGERDLALAQELAHRAALAIDNAGLFSAVQEADRRKDDSWRCWPTSCATRWRRFATRPTSCKCSAHNRRTSSGPAR